MKRTCFLFLLFALLMSGCRFRGTKDPVDASHAFPDGQISLGGVIAEQLSDFNRPDSSRIYRVSLVAGKIKQLQDQSEELKENDESAVLESFYRDWQDTKEKIRDHFEYLSEDDLKAWVSLNDSLLKYSGEVRFADELEKMIYSAPVPEVISEEMIKSFCYSRLYDRIYVNVYGSSAVEYEHTTGGRVRIFQDTKYPYDGRIKIKVELQDTRYLDLFIRIPQWSDQASVRVKGVMYNVVPGEYAEVARRWENGDEVDIVLGMRPEVVRRYSTGLAFIYGPLFLSYVPGKGDTLTFKGSDPTGHLQLVSPPGEMPTFTFSGIPQEPLVLQPFFAEQEEPGTRTAWIRTSH